MVSHSFEGSTKSVGRVRSLRKRHPIGFGIGAFFSVMLLGAGVAFAAIMFLAPVTGSVSSAKASVQWTSTTVTATGDAATCTGAVNSGSLAITMTNAYPGGSCDYRGAVGSYGSTEPMVLTGVNIGGLPTGWTAALDPTMCGTVFNPGTTTLADSARSAGFTIAMAATGAASNGSTTQLTPVGSGLQFTPQSQYVKATMCP